MNRVEDQKLNQTTEELSFRWVFGVQLDSLEKSVIANAEKPVDFIPTFLTTQFLYSPQGTDVCSIEGKSPHNLFASMFPCGISKFY